MYVRMDGWKAGQMKGRTNDGQTDRQTNSRNHNFLLPLLSFSDDLVSQTWRILWQNGWESQ